MSSTTKKALAASLKKLLEKKTLEKITISDITDECEVNRQTFYYHFQDVYDLIEWIYTSESMKALDGRDTYGTWQQGFLRIFYYVRENKRFVTSTYHSVSRDHLEGFLHREVHLLLLHVIEEMAEGISLREDDRGFLADFYSYAFTGLMLDWVGKGMKEEPEVLIRRISLAMEGNIVNAIERFQTGKILK